ncbi:MAG: EamA family transporter [Syntrophomonadaceae bacterium]|nr:EamA family transporter [Syntrophomonadaceae bacterium]
MMTARTSTKLSRAGLIHLAVVYIIWSSTYLAIRVAVAEGSGFPPFTMVAGWMLFASLILLGFAAFRRHRIKPSFNELLVLAVSSTLLWVGGNGLVVWAEQHANSGFAALVVATAPIWAALFDSLLSRKPPALLLVGSLLFGFCGLSLLMVPSLLHGGGTELLSGIALLAAAVSWSLGSVFQARYPLNFVSPVVSGYQHLIAGFVFVLIALVCREPAPSPTSSVWIAWAYLIVFGSVIAFTSYINAIRLLPINIAMTYAYVNPVLALFLGWWLLDERTTVWTILGAAMVVAGIFGIFKARFQQKTGSELPAAGEPG